MSEFLTLLDPIKVFFYGEGRYVAFMIAWFYVIVAGIILIKRKGDSDA